MEELLNHGAHVNSKVCYNSLYNRSQNKNKKRFVDKSALWWQANVSLFGKKAKIRRKKTQPKVIFLCPLVVLAVVGKFSLDYPLVLNHVTMWLHRHHFTGLLNQAIVQLLSYYWVMGLTRMLRFVVVFCLSFFFACEFEIRLFVFLCIFQNDVSLSRFARFFWVCCHS